MQRRNSEDIEEGAGQPSTSGLPTAYPGGQTSSCNEVSSNKNKLNASTLASDHQYMNATHVGGNNGNQSIPMNDRGSVTASVPDGAVTADVEINAEEGDIVILPVNQQTPKK